jgi:Tol biopolymer transport system component
MPFEAGQQLQHYRLVEPIGEGGMGVVWRALDTTLGREVAIKVLPDALTADPERLARFEREAKLLASLNHPNIAQIYAFEKWGPARGSAAAPGADTKGVPVTTFGLVMELVEGPTVAERLAQGSLSLTESLSIARQVAEALEEAHEKGIVHRDLKPQNVKASTEGKVKVLDFGLAKAMDPAGAPSSSGSSSPADVARSPTLTSAGTVAGLILGTAAYMSPEQAAGQPVDRRCDIWSFGVLLAEMLTGRRMFAGETVSHTLADVLRAPIDLADLPAATPPAVRRLIERCLVRDRQRRLRDIGEARIALEDALEQQRADSGAAAAPGALTPATAPTPVTAASRARPARLPWIVAVAALALAAGALLWHGGGAPPRPQSSLRFSIETPNEGGQRQGDGVHVALSPDGQTLVTSGGTGEKNGLYLRTLDRFDSRKLEGTTGGNRPVFSPDGAWIAFLAGAELRKVPLAGGPPIRIGRLPASPDGLSWGGDGFLYYGQHGKLFRIPDAGGEPEILKSTGKEKLGFPKLLPGGKTLLASGTLVATRGGNLAAYDLATGAVKDLGVEGSDPRYLPTGQILYARKGQAYVAPFDLGALAVTGASAPVLPRLWVDQDELQAAVSPDGTVAYLPAAPGSKRLRLVSATLDGKLEPLLADDLPFTSISDPRFSHDGRRIVLSADNGQLWMIDLDTQTPTLMSDSGFYAYWSPDDRDIIYTSPRGESFDIYRRPVDLSRPEKLLIDVADNLRAADWTRQGVLIVREEVEDKGMDLNIVTNPDDPRTMKPLLAGPDDELAPNVSADGHWLAFVSDYSGSDEVYVTTFPTPGGRSQVSVQGGNSPVWAPDGKTLYYFEGNALIAASVETAPRFRVTSRKTVIRGDFLTYRWSRMDDIDPTGKRFVFIQMPTTGNVEVITHWFDELRGKGKR